ncbi:MAG: hypothetical protein M1837_003530 [Sclerophora amabilis]|nr:MAG: hypothetical protein M1837_003530 [Sclerophora amabilis]
MFLLGFVADPIINLYLDPFTTISSVPLPNSDSKAHPIIPSDESSTWAEHFVKGLASLGLLSFIKVLLAMSPWQWWNLRSSGFMSGSGRGAGASGRDRLASISWIVVLVGVGTFLWAVYKGVRAWSRKALEKAGERVMDVQGDDEDEHKEESSDTTHAADNAHEE